MILLRILKRDIVKKKIVLAVVFIFIMLSALLVAAGSDLIVRLSGSLDELFSAARIPHFVQMHAGEIDRREIEEWASGTDRVEELQTAEMITVNGSALYLDEAHGSEENSVMDIGFVRQNEEFDFLLDTGNRVIHPVEGEIAVPVYYLQNREIEIGDTVHIRDDSFEMELTVSAFLRDAQMNPSIVHSKRFLLHETDYAKLGEHFSGREYLIEFLLEEPGELDAFADSYASSSLPKRGPAVDRRLLATLNALTDGIVSAAVIVLSLLLMLIALLCLRFTILATIEEDYREIGVMKAVGMTKRHIKRIYLSKYLLLAGAASVAGYLSSHFLGRFFTGDMQLYLGNSGPGFAGLLVPPATALAIFLVVLLSCLLILRRVDRISAVEALRAGTTGSGGGRAGRIPLQKSGPLDVNVFLGLRDVLQRFRLFAILCFIFFFSSCIILLPLHVLSTVTSPGFISYMGIGRSDIRIDLRNDESVSARYDKMLSRIAEDGEVERYAPLVTSQFTMIGKEGERETIAVETGDFSIFPLDYIRGHAPENGEEIAVSYLNSEDLGKEVGDSITLFADGERRELEISGIYQDVTDGGKTAKARLPYDPDEVIWHTVSMDLVPSADVEEKREEYAELFHPARVTDMESYIEQTLGNTIDQLSRVTLVAMAVGLAVSVLITSLFLSMLIAKDSSRIAIMQSIGFSLKHLRMQYLSTAAAVLAAGVLLGTLFSNTLGSRLVALVWGQMGAPHISFVIDPLLSYLLLPLLLFAAVAVTTVLGTGAVKNHKIAQ